MPILTALCATCALPPLVPPVEIRGSIYYDGGIMCNMPLRYADDLFPETRDHALGFQFDFRERDSISFDWSSKEWPSLVNLAANVISMLFYRIAYLDSQLTYEASKRVLLIPSEGHDTASIEEKRKLHSTRSLVALRSDPETLQRMYEFGRNFVLSK